jgi:hypothetical protein
MRPNDARITVATSEEEEEWDDGRADGNQERAGRGDMSLQLTTKQDWGDSCRKSRGCVLHSYLGTYLPRYQRSAAIVKGKMIAVAGLHERFIRRKSKPRPKHRSAQSCGCVPDLDLAGMIATAGASACIEATSCY